MAEFLEIGTKMIADLSQWTPKFNEWNKDLEKGGENVGRLASDLQILAVGIGLEKFGGMVEQYITIPLVDAATASFNLALGFDEQMHGIQSIGEQTGKEIETLGGQFLDMSMDIATGTTNATKLAEAFYFIQGSGFDGSDALKVLAQSSTLAMAAMSNSSDAATALVYALNAYHLPASEAARVSDILFTTVDEGIGLFPDLASSVGRVAGEAYAAGISMEELFGAITSMSRVLPGFSATVSSLFMLLRQLLNPTEALQNLFDKAGVESGAWALENLGLMGTLQILQDATGGEAGELEKLFSRANAMRGVTTLLGADMEDFATDMQKMNQSTGRTLEAAEINADALARKIDILKNAFGAAGIKLAENFFPLVEDLVKIGTDAVSVMAEWDESQQKFALAVGAGAAAVGPLASGAGTLMQSLAALDLVLLANGKSIGWLFAAGGPWFIAAATIGAAAAALAILTIEAESVERTFQEQEKSLQTSAETWDEYRETLIGSREDMTLLEQAALASNFALNQMTGGFVPLKEITTLTEEEFNKLRERMDENQESTRKATEQTLLLREELGLESEGILNLVTSEEDLIRLEQEWARQNEITQANLTISTELWDLQALHIVEYGDTAESTYSKVRGALTEMEGDFTSVFVAMEETEAEYNEATEEMAIEHSDEMAEIRTDFWQEIKDLVIDNVQDMEDLSRDHEEAMVDIEEEYETSVKDARNQFYTDMREMKEGFEQDQERSEEDFALRQTIKEESYNLARLQAQRTTGEKILELQGELSAAEDAGDTDKVTKIQERINAENAKLSESLLKKKENYEQQKTEDERWFALRQEREKKDHTERVKDRVAENLTDMALIKQKYVDETTETEGAFKAKKEKESEEYLLRKSEIESQYAEESTLLSQKHVDEKQKLDEDHATREEDQRKHLGQLLIDFTTENAEILNLSAGQAEDMTKKLEEEYGLQEKDADEKFAAMRTSMGQWALQGTKDYDEIIGKIDDLVIDQGKLRSDVATTTQSFIPLGEGLLDAGNKLDNTAWKAGVAGKEIGISLNSVKDKAVEAAKEIGSMGDRISGIPDKTIKVQIQTTGYEEWMGPMSPKTKLQGRFEMLERYLKRNPFETSLKGIGDIADVVDPMERVAESMERVAEAAPGVGRGLADMASAGNKMVASIDGISGNSMADLMGNGEPTRESVYSGGTGGLDMENIDRLDRQPIFAPAIATNGGAQIVNYYFDLDAHYANTQSEAAIRDDINMLRMLVESI